MTQLTGLEDRLNDFDAISRWQAFDQLRMSVTSPVKRRDDVNMHIHTFYSFNAEGWSPLRAAWEAHRRGWAAAGIIDFDVSDGMDEFFNAGEILGLRTCVGVETRVFYKEYADREIDSPGEPGVHYVAGTGFVRNFPEGTVQAEGLAFYRRAAQERNRALISRINPHVPEIALDYETDVLPRSPGRCPTERHIIAAYIDKSIAALPDESVETFWAGLLRLSREEVGRLLANRSSMEEKVRARLAKRGGLGYEQPTCGTFPPLEDFFGWVASCGAVPMESWLDGTSEGEADGRGLLERSVAQGARALNIIPDRNWNIADSGIKAVKVANLRRMVGLAAAMDLPINIGTEMNRAGLPYVDDLNGPVLCEFREPFIRGAMILVGHSTCARFAGFSYAGTKAMAEFGHRAAMNLFFESVGRLPPVTREVSEVLRMMGEERAYGAIRDAVRAGTWCVTR